MPVVRSDKHWLFIIRSPIRIDTLLPNYAYPTATLTHLIVDPKTLYWKRCSILQITLFAIHVKPYKVFSKHGSYGILSMTIVLYSTHTSNRLMESTGHISSPRNKRNRLWSILFVWQSHFINQNPKLLLTPWLGCYKQFSQVTIVMKQGLNSLMKQEDATDPI